MEDFKLNPNLFKMPIPPKLPELSRQEKFSRRLRPYMEIIQILTLIASIGALTLSIVAYK